MSSEKIIAIKIGEQKSLSRMKLIWEETFFQITILDGKNAWLSAVNMEDLPKLAVQLDQDFESYSKSLYSVLFNPEENDENIYSFNIVNNEFIIFKKIDQDMRVKYFFTKLKKTDYHTCAETFIDELLNKNSFLENQHATLQELVNKEVKERTSVTEKYQDLKHKIERTEKELYSAFTLLLNEKKMRIQYLTELIECQRNNSSLKMVGSNKTKQNLKADDINSQNERANAKRQKTETVSDSDNEDDGDESATISYDYSTDEEKQQKAKSAVTGDNIAVVPSTSKNDIIDLITGTSKSVSLPKRLKNHENTDYLNISTESDIQSPFNNQTSEISKSEEKVKTPEEITRDEEESPIEFSTQDMLDLM